MPVLKYASKLEAILKIGDTIERQQTLIDYARSLNINIDNVRKPNGHIDEDRLTVFIFNAERTKALFQFQHIGIIAGVIFVLVMLMAGIFLFLKFK